MRFHYADAMFDPQIWLPLAQALEEAGWDGITVPDSICYPEVSDSTYPYTPDGDRSFLEDKPFVEPFSLIAAMGAVTTRLRFTTFVLKLPVRHPVLVAKSVSSVAVLTGGRLDLGVGSSPWPDDYRVTGVPWKARGKRMDECIAIINGLLSGEYYRHEGELYDIESIKLCPVPAAPVPLLIGGHSDRALRRAATVGDGWLHAGGPPEGLPRLLEKLTVYREEAGRSERPFSVRVISRDAYTPDGIARLEAVGVTDVIVGFRNS
jgi:probable F420-dependent oxidoreductase